MGIAGWLVVAVAVALVIGRLFHLREKSIGQDRPPMPMPRPTASPAQPGPSQSTSRIHDGHSHEVGRGLLGRPVPRVPQQRTAPRGRRSRIGPSTRRG
ncbi:hypothetical protein TOK_2998 [Pseudonocardia sp. N23]|nr:hypothetical protein TOK_2998 [Pseudonocardia sp. N23]